MLGAQNPCLIEVVSNNTPSQTCGGRPPDKSVYQKIIFLISQPKCNMLWVLKRTILIDGSFEHPKHMFEMMGKKIIIILP